MASSQARDSALTSGSNLTDLDSLRKPIDGYVSRHINRHVSLAITRRLRHTGIRPNHVSSVTLLLGLMGGLIIAQGGYWAGVWGTLTLQIQSVLDGVDGELARLKNQGSRLGQWLDTISDDLGELAFIVGASVAIFPSPLSWLGAGAAFVYIAAKGVMYYTIATVYHSGDLLVLEWRVDRAGTWMARLKRLLKHDAFCLMAFFLALIDQLNIALLVACLGSFAMAAGFFFQYATTGFRPKTAGKD